MGSVTPIKKKMSMSVSFFPCATACADRCMRGTNSLLSTSENFLEKVLFFPLNVLEFVISVSTLIKTQSQQMLVFFYKFTVFHWRFIYC